MPRLMVLFASAVAGCITTPVMSAADSSRAPDEAAVVAVTRGFVDAWNRHDMSAMGNLFTEDADFVNVIGQRWIGSEAIKAAHAASHATIFRNSRLTIAHITVRFLATDVAVARFTAKLTGELDRAGHEQPPRYALPTFVMTRGGEGWLIAVAQNTNINTDISPVDF